MKNLIKQTVAFVNKQARVVVATHRVGNKFLAKSFAEAVPEEKAENVMLAITLTIQSSNALTAAYIHRKHPLTSKVYSVASAAMTHRMVSKFNDLVIDAYADINERKKS